MAQSPPRPELLALLAAVKDEPDDDTPKLALADWLQEQDDEADRARGEYVRELVGYRCGASTSLTDEVPERLKRAETLLITYERVWFGWLEGTGYTHRLVDSHWGLPCLALDLGNPPGGRGIERHQLAWVAGLSVRSVNDSFVRRLATGRGLDPFASLILQGGPQDLNSIRVLVNSDRVANLRRLGFVTLHADLDAVARSPRLTRLREFVTVPGITYLSGATDHEFKSLCDSRYLSELRLLHLPRRALGVQAARAFSEGAGLPALHDLDLRMNRIGPDGTLIMVASASTGRLRKLNLRGNGIADYGVEAICRQPHVCDLTHLDVSANLLTNRTGFAVAEAEHLNSLEELNLSNNAIGEDGALALARSPHLANLRRLDLSGNLVGAGATGSLRERFGNAVVL